MSQVKNGKAFEYALVLEISRLTRSKITDNTAAQIAKDYYNSISGDNRKHFDRAADEASVFLECHDDRFDKSHLITLQSDSKGKDGDVRDIIVSINDRNEIGISAKHNHQAVKHSRLSDKIDFGKDWCNYPVSNNYWKSVKPIFSDLRQRKEKSELFKNIPNKDSTIYLPVLSAFEDELRVLCEDFGRNFIKCLFQYLTRRHDFYKVVCGKKSVNVQSVNIGGTLEWGKRWKIPSRIEQIKRKIESKNTLLITFEGGWQLSFRLHSASSRVEPSLKFDIQFVGMSQSVTRHEIPLR
ncbi:MAG: HaeIII family restriction endonuclease [Ekhidna sp.]|nr:HaeIII family restriction endonuclease [Ekhidna sp.]